MHLNRTIAVLIISAHICGAGAVHAQTVSIPVGPDDRIAVSTAYEYATITASGAEDLRVRAAAHAPGGRSIPVRVAHVEGLVRVEVPLAPGVESRAIVRIELSLPGRAPHVALAVPRGTLDVTRLTGRVVMESASGVIRARHIGHATIHSSSGSVTVQGTTGDVSLRTSSANVRLERVRGTVVGQIGSGNLTLHGVTGNLDVTAASGNVIASGIGGDARAVSINGRTELFCVAGRVDITDTSGAIRVEAAAGDVHIDTATGRALVVTRLRSGGRYVLKTLDGRIELRIPAESRDFGATLSAYLKRIDIGAPFDAAETARDRDGRRLTLRVGSDQARIDLEAFGGRLTLTAGVPRPCDATEVSR